MKVKNITADSLSAGYIQRFVDPGETVEVPDTQGDGSPLVWDPQYWEVVKEKPAKADKAVKE